MKRAKPKLLFTDAAGNRLYQLDKSDGVTQFFAKNVEGKLVNYQGARLLIRRAGLGGFVGFGQKIGQKKRGKTTFTRFKHKGEIRGRMK